MTLPRFRTCSLIVLSLALAAHAAAIGPGWGQDDWRERVWRAALEGREDQFRATLGDMPEQIASAPHGSAVREAIDLLERNIARREETRGQEIARVSGELDERLAGRDDVAISRALVSAVELYMVSIDKPGVLADPRVADLVWRAERAAKEAEERGETFIASELIQRLNVLFEEQATYRSDAMRQVRRLAMVRLYAPAQFWKMRNDRRLAERDLPPYNPTGDDFRAKLAGINERMVAEALGRAARTNLDGVPGSRLAGAGLEALETMSGTRVLREVFPGLADDARRAQFEAFLAEQRRLLNARPGEREMAFPALLERVLAANERTVRIDRGAILHEFGNGAMSALDEFSAIIWPDEIRDFRRATQARFVGVGIQIRMDALANIEVVTPLDQTPALRAGIRPGDIIRKVDGEPTLGFTIDQAVEVITGPPGTTVRLAIERPGDLDEAGKPREIEFALQRQQIPLKTIAGWQRTGPAEDDWDWFADADRRIGYVRIKSFSEQTTGEFDRAVAQMRHVGLRGLVVDLRFNPGGLLDEAVILANRFIDQGGRVIVSTHDANDVAVDTQVARRQLATLAGVPVVLLVNEGSASASEIVSGAVQHYAHQGDLRAALVGERSFGKGSVQNVWELRTAPAGQAMVKVTTQHYRLPDRRMIHRSPGARTWGVDPDLRIEMLAGRRRSGSTPTPPSTPPSPAPPTRSATARTSSSRRRWSCSRRRCSTLPCSRRRSTTEPRTDAPLRSPGGGSPDVVCARRPECAMTQAKAMNPGAGGRGEPVAARPSAGLPDGTLLDWLRMMQLIREFEVRCAQAYQQAKIGGFCHVYIGQEASAVGTLACTRPDEPVITAYRDHGHALARGMSPRACMAEMFGKLAGCAKGKGGSMHMFDRPNMLFGGHGIVGAQIPLGAGLAFALRYERDVLGGDPLSAPLPAGADRGSPASSNPVRGAELPRRICLCYLGDGALNQGAFHESMNLAGLYSLPAIFICENNGYSMGTSVERGTTMAHDLSRKAAAYGMDYLKIDGMDVLNVYDRFLPFADECRRDQKPAFVNLITYRYQGHSMSDPQKYRTKEEVERWKERDSIASLAAHLMAPRAEGGRECMTEERWKEVQREVRDVVRDALAFADAAEPPDPAKELYSDVLVNPQPGMSPLGEYVRGARNPLPKSEEAD
jgi:pyruvate dehydrogenase E1 component alpha subunit